MVMAVIAVCCAVMVWTALPITALDQTVPEVNVQSAIMATRALIDKRAMELLGESSEIRKQDPEGVAYIIEDVVESVPTTTTNEQSGSEELTQIKPVVTPESHHLGEFASRFNTITETIVNYLNRVEPKVFALEAAKRSLVKAQVTVEAATEFYERAQAASVEADEKERIASVNKDTSREVYVESVNALNNVIQYYNDVVIRHNSIVDEIRKRYTELTGMDIMQSGKP